MLLTQFCRVGHGSMHQEKEKEGAEHRQTGENEQTKTKERNETWGYFNTRAICFLHMWQGLNTYVGCWHKGTDISGYRPAWLPWLILKRQQFTAPEGLAQRDEVGEHITPKTENVSQPLFWSSALIPEDTSFGQGCDRILLNLKSRVWSFA